MNERAPTFPERDASLWRLVVPPTLWFVHFLLSYGTAAVWCAKYADESWGRGATRAAIAAYTIVALAGIVAAGRRGFAHHRYDDAELPHDDDTPADRHRFLGYATLLLAGLSFVATLYVASAAVFAAACT